MASVKRLPDRPKIPMASIPLRPIAEALRPIPSPDNPSPEAQAARFQQLTVEINHLKTGLSAATHAIGTRLKEVQDARLWEGRGYDTFEQYLAEGVTLSRRQAYRLIRVSGAFTETQALTHGSTKLDAVLQYAQKVGLPTADKALAASIDVGPKDATSRLAIAEATTAQIRAAIQRLTRAERKPIPATVRKRVEKLERLLPPAPPGTRQTNRARLRQAADGSMVLELSSLPLTEIPALIDALKSTFLV